MPSPAKTELRRFMRAQLARMSSAARAAASESIRTSIPSLPRWQAARAIAAFAALPDEPDLQPFDWSPQRELLLPRVAGDTLVFHRVASKADLAAGAFGVAEPDPHKCPTGDPADADIIFVPGVAFTAEGRRLGRGRGYYDRLLQQLPASVMRIGVCFADQIAAELPCEPHDQAVDIVLAPELQRQ